MGFLDRFRGRQLPEQSGQQAKPLIESDKKILAHALEHGTPCVPFIPVKELAQDLIGIRPEALTGYFVARIPALYEDGSIRYLYKEEGALLFAVQGCLNQMQKTGRSYFLLGMDVEMNWPMDRPYVNPSMFQQPGQSLFNIDFDEKVDIIHGLLSPSLEMTYVPSDHNPRIRRINVVNFFLVALLHPPEERGDPSGTILSYEDWKRLQYPTSGPELKDLLRRQAETTKKALGL